MATPDLLATYLEIAKRTGCPPDQLRNFRIGRYAAQPMQLLFHAAAREADLPDGPDEIGLGGSRGPGKSHAIFAQVALDDCQRAAGLKCLYLRKVSKQAREQLDDLRRKVLMSTPHNYRRHDGVIVFPNGSRIVTGHFRYESDVDNYLGLEYDVIAIEETTTLSEMKYKTLRDSNRTSRDDWRARIYNSTNPGGIGHQWYKKRFIEPYRSMSETYTRFIPGTVDDNAFIGQDYTRRLEENTGWRLRAYRHGDWDIAAGQFFSTFRHDIHVTRPFRIPGDWVVWCAMDYGYNHYTVVYLFAEDGDGNVYTVAEYAARQTAIKVNASGIKDMLARHGVELRRLRTFVAGSDVFAKRSQQEATIATKYRRQDISLKSANSDRINGAAEMLARLGDVNVEPTWYIFDTCPMLLECLPSMVHDPRRPEDVLKVNINEDGEGGDDAYDAARYGLMVAGRPKMTSAQVDWHAQHEETRPTSPAGRSAEEVERMLSAYE